MPDEVRGKLAATSSRFGSFGGVLQENLTFLAPGVALRYGAFVPNLLGIETGLSFIRKGTHLTEGDSDLIIDYVVAPLLLRAELQPALGVRPHLAFGPYVGLRVGTDGFMDASGIATTDVGVTARGGLGWRALGGVLPTGTIIEVELEYDIGFTRIVDGTERTNQTLVLGVGFSFDFGGDRDADGKLNRHEGFADRCWIEAEDVDGFEDADGCPDPDNDQDTVVDAKDKCPGVDAEDPEKTAEDIDGFEDDDGCPDPDNDQDEIADSEDACPDVPYWDPLEKSTRLFSDAPAEPFLGQGNPEKPETKDGIGCPARYAHFEVRKEYLRLVEASQINRFEPGSDTAIEQCDIEGVTSTKASECYQTVVAEVAQFLKHYPWVKLRIEGHASKGEKGKGGKRPDEERATRVFEALTTTHKIDKERLLPVGVGDASPFTQSYRPPRVIKNPGAKPPGCFKLPSQQSKETRETCRRWPIQVAAFKQYQHDLKQYRALVKKTEPSLNRRVTFVIESD